MSNEIDILDEDDILDEEGGEENAAEAEAEESSESTAVFEDVVATSPRFI